MLQQVYSLYRFIRMSFQAPPTLLSLAVQSLVKNEALAINALQELPRELFPPLFKAALTGINTTILKEMVGSWNRMALPDLNQRLLSHHSCCLLFKQHPLCKDPEGRFGRPLDLLVSFPNVTTLITVVPGKCY